MNPQDGSKPQMNRRKFLALTGGAVAAASSASLGASGVLAQDNSQAPLPQAQAVPFFGEHQAGILTPAQNHTYFAAFDITTKSARKSLTCFSAGQSPRQECRRVNQPNRCRRI